MGVDKVARPLYAVRCHGDSVPEAPSCGVVELDHEQYKYQLSKPNSLWYCPNCGSGATWCGSVDD